jgi:hypothetical protein
MMSVAAILILAWLFHWAVRDGVFATETAKTEAVPDTKCHSFSDRGLLELLTLAKTMSFFTLEAERFLESTLSRSIRIR